MTLSLSWRLAPVILAAATLLLAGCGSTPADDITGKSAEKLYAEAKDEMESGSYDRAIKALERVEGLGAGSLLAQQAQLDLAYLYWKTAEKALALSTIERFIKLNPSSPGLDYALYLRGMINSLDDLGLFSTIAGQDMSERDQRAARDAYQAFRQLVDQFPDSAYAGDARQRMARIIDSLAAYEVHVARYYFRRGAYVAAVNRAQQAVTEFQHSPATEEALYILMSSYEKLELDALRDDAGRVLKQNFPDSRFLSIGLADKSAWWRLW